MAISNQLHEMRYIFIPDIQEVPQWKQLYYKSETLKKLTQISQKSDYLIRSLHRKYQSYQKTGRYEIKSHKQIQKFLKIQQISRSQLSLKQIQQQSCHKFFQFSCNQTQTLYIFVQYKIFQLKERLDRLTYYSKIVEHNDLNLISLIQNTYIEIHYLKRMIEYNISQQSITKRELQLYLDESQLLDEERGKRKMQRMYTIVNKMIDQIQKIYIVKKTQTQNISLKELMRYGNNQQHQQNKKFIYNLGFGMGILLVCFGALIFFKQYHNISLETNKTYASDFPIWRGASYIIFYQWMLGFSFLFLQSTQINYKLILTLQSQTVPKPQQLLFNAQNVTTIYLVFFCLYMLQMGGVLKTDFKYWGHIVWLLIFMYYLIPLPFVNNKGKFYFIKLIFKVLISPFTRSNGLLIWITQQLVSNSQTFSDFFYSCCKLNDYQSKCLMIPDATLAIIIILFTFRFIQNTKIIYQNNWKIIPPFYGLFRIITSVFLAIMSWIYRKKMTDDYFAVFIFAGCLSTCVAFLVDLKTDWGMLNGELLRKNLFFSKYMSLYYVIIVADFFLRANWSLNMSPTFVNSLNILPYYMIMIVTYLQLFRRAMWNILRVQLQHAESCARFKATISDNHLQINIKNQYNLKNLLFQNVNLQAKREKIIRDNNQMDLLNQNLRNRENYKKTILNFIEKNNKKIEKIRKEIQSF